MDFEPLDHDVVADSRVDRVGCDCHSAVCSGRSLTKVDNGCERSGRFGQCHGRRQEGEESQGVHFDRADACEVEMLMLADVEMLRYKTTARRRLFILTLRCFRGQVLSLACA